MALAFKRAVGEAQAAIDSTNKSIKEWYKTPVDPAFVVDWDGIKTVEGVSTQNPNSVEGPKNITLVNWVKDNANYFHSVWGDVQYKDKEYVALIILNKHLERVVLHVDDKSAAGKYNSYNVEWKGKECHLTVHIDFTNYPQALKLTDEDNGHVDQLIWDHLDDVADISYEIRKATAINYSSSQYNTYKKYLADKIKKEIPLLVDWDSVIKLEGKSLEYSNKPPVPNRARAVTFLEDGRGFYNIYYAIEKLVGDEMGMSAFLETFDKILVSVAPGSTEVRSGPHSVTKEGKTLKFQFKLNMADIQNASADYSELAKQIEALL